jgi:hypothetical protein
MPPNLANNLLEKPLFDPTYLNVDYYFNKVLEFFHLAASFHIGPTVYFVSYALSLFGITMILYCLVRMVEIAGEENSHLKHAIAEYAARRNDETAGTKNERWDHIQDLVNSENPSDWRLAIIEADSVLDTLLTARDLPGKGIGEKLKSISPGDLGSMQAAWEAHLVRNKIAHEGSEFDLSNREARRTIQLYEVVFRELGFL